MKFRAGEHSRLALSWGLQSQALSIAWIREASWGNFDLTLQVDDIDYQDANYLSLSFGLQLGRN